MAAADDLFDLAVVGGGINGCGIARDAAGRGARVLLLERGDLAQGTSSASTKLIHGGLRYLEHHEFGLVREALAERERLWAIAPHIIRPMRFVLPWVEGLRPHWLLRAGLLAYDHLGGRRRLPPTRSIDLSRHEAGEPLRPELRRGFVYSDCWVDDARLVVLNARDAADRGAQVRTGTEVLRLERGEQGWALATTQGTFHARAVVNAAGPSVLSVVGRAARPSSRALRLVRGSHIVVPRLFAHDCAYLFQHRDGRVFFAIPFERDFTLIGTTDREHDGPLHTVSAAPDEIAYLCEAASRYFRAPVTSGDVVWSYAGVRPLVSDGTVKPEAASRGYAFEMDGGEPGQAPLLSVFGGKITTYRRLAEEAMRRLQRVLPNPGGTDWTAGSALPGGDFPLDGVPALISELSGRYPFLEPVWAERIARAYGTRAFAWLGTAGRLSDLGEHFGHGLTEAEVDHLMREEWARSAEDVLWRRTKLGLRFDAAKTARLARAIGEG